jgi:hypothetical protein
MILGRRRQRRQRPPRCRWADPQLIQRLAHYIALAICQALTFQYVKRFCDAGFSLPASSSAPLLALR